MKKVETRKITDLTPHSLNKEIYNDTCDKNLLDDIKKNGILTPLLITHDNRIISGHKRFEAAQVKKLKELEVIVYDKKDELDIKEAIINSNKQRDKTNEQKGREYAALLDIEKQRAAQRKKNTQPQKGQQVGSSQVTQNSAGPDETGEARKIAAKKVGLSHDTAKKISKINEAIDECRKTGDTKLADELLKTLNDKSVNSAYKQAKAEELITDGIPAETSEDTKTEPQFNRTVQAIDWAGWSWNPITGCRQGCKYCYAKDMANRFSDNKDFEPRFYEKRLDAPTNTKFRDEYKANIRLRSVFVCSMGDLFGDGVEEEWIDKVMDTIKKAPQWNFLFLTKSPKRMAQYMGRKGVPSNSWAGATVDKTFRIKPTIEAFREIEAKVKYLYCEPLLEDLASNELMSALIKMVDWVLIGAQRRNIKNKVPEFQPKWDWVERLVNQARAAGCPVYFKSNLTVRPQEYPECDNSLEARLAKLKEKLPEEFDNIAEEWDQRESNNRGSEYMKNFQLYQFLKDKEKKLEEEGTGDKTGTAKDKKTESEKKKLDAGKNKGNGNGTGEKERTGSTEEPAQSPISVN